MTAPGLACAACGTALRMNAKFCDECGSPLAASGIAAEYKQVTVLFADVVHSMDIAAAVGAERLREIMTDLVKRTSVVVRRYGGTVDKFTGDGIMAIFGAPIALEDHAVRACAAALDIQEKAKRLATEVEAKDGITLQLRVGLNSGEVIAGEIGSGPGGYTAIGQQVGMAQRMESVAPAGGVMLSASTARLVENAAVLGDPELVRIKGAADPVFTRCLVALAALRGRMGPHALTLVGREWELAALTAMLDRSIKGHGCVAAVVGPPGIGKSRIVAETAAIADGRGVQVFSTYCESHTSEIPFHAVTWLLRAALGIEDVDDETARATIRAQVPGADSADLVLIDDLLGVRDPAAELPDIAPDARRRRLTALVNTAALARSTPRVYVIEDAHWIDRASESMLADFLAVIPKTYSLVLITHRPEYRGALSRTTGAQTIALAALDDLQAGALIEELLGSDHSVAGLAEEIGERAAGNPFFAEQIVHDLADRGLLSGERGAYVCSGEAAKLHVPASLQAAIASRIDRLDPAAKRTLNAAAVIGLRFGEELLASLVDNAVVTPLIEAELIDQVMFTPRAEYAFRHPLIRTVAYESQLKSGRADLHRRVAAATEDALGSIDENAAVVAEHFEAAGELHAAFAWHMRAATWLTVRDMKAARMSWQRAAHVADRLPPDDRERTVMRIAPRARLCGTTWRVGGSVADTGFDELRALATAAADNTLLAIGMAGHIMALLTHACYRESSELATELTRLIDSIDDPTQTVAVLWAAPVAKLRTGEIAEVLRLAERIIDVAGGDPTKGKLIIESPLTIAVMLRAEARMCMGHPDWKHDIEQGVALCRRVNPGARAAILAYAYGLGILTRTLLPDAAAARETAEALEAAERRGDDYALASARFLRGFTLVHLDDTDRRDGFDLLDKAREGALAKRFLIDAVQIIELENAKEIARIGDLEAAIERLRAVVDGEYATGEVFFRAAAVTALVESLLQRGTDADVTEAQAAIERLAAVPTEPGFVLYDVALLRMRALVARARGDDAAYRDFADRYRNMARSLGFEGHIAIAETMAHSSNSHL